jgi:hypothetical protein
VAGTQLEPRAGRAEAGGAKDPTQNEVEEGYVTDDGAVNATLTTDDKCSLHIFFFIWKPFFVSCHLKTFSRMNHVSVISLLLSFIQFLIFVVVFYMLLCIVKSIYISLYLLKKCIFTLLYLLK